MTRLLVVAGEGSGDALAAPVLSQLGVESFGLGGTRAAAAGMEQIADARSTASMGFVEVLTRVPPLVRALATIVRETRRRRPRAALLVGFSEPNARLAPWLRRRGVRVLWYAPPQTWAWRAGRSQSIADACDRLAVLLPFEAEIWERFGARVHYVGHPARDLAFSPEGPRPGAPLRVALLPGSRGHEVRRHLLPLLGATRLLATRRGPVAPIVVKSPGLDDRADTFLERACREAAVPVVARPVELALPGHHVALCSSGTATLECATLGVPPVIVYRTGAATYAVARRLVRVRHVGLPNLVLGYERFPELLQGAVAPLSIARAAEDVLDAHGAHVEGCREVRARLHGQTEGDSPAVHVARLLRPWLC